MAAFSETRFRAVWSALPESTKEKIRAKAQWEHMSLAAVMREWWPRLWRRVEEDTDDGNRRTNQRTRNALPGVRKPRAARTP